MHHHFTASAAREHAREQLWVDLEAEARAVAAVLDGVDFLESEAAEHVAARMALQDGQVGNTGHEVLVLDRDGRVIYPAGVYQRGDLPDQRHRSVVEWPTEPGAPELAAASGRGKVMMGGLEHVAAGYAVDGGLACVLSLCPASVFKARTALPLPSWSLLTVITFIWTCALLNIAVYLILARLHDEIDRERTQSTSEVLRQAQHLARTRDAVIFGLARLAESRDTDTGDHLERISVYSTMIASALRRHEKYRDEVTPGFVQVIGISSALHDIGKVGVEDRILLKPGPLTPSERADMQVHTVIGGECLRGIEKRLGGSNFLQMAREIAFAHHENWNGAGYPYGLSGTSIPLSARIVAIADIYDALSTKRVYKPALPHEECVAIIHSQAGVKLDPDLVDVWMTLEARFRTIASGYVGDIQLHTIEPPGGTEPVFGSPQNSEVLCMASAGAPYEHAR
jgi:hypothetical protein